MPCYNRGMKTGNLDIVYFVKESVSNEELRYSLRSIEKNFPHHRVFIYGGAPEWLAPGHHIAIKQEGTRKYDRVQSMFRDVCLNDAITEDFVLMNDDFFVMKKTTTLKPAYRCALSEHIKSIKGEFGANTYSHILQQANDELGTYYGQKSYELHIPMVINRHKMLEILGAFPGVHAIRSLYGNYHSIGGKQMDDVKVYEMAQQFDKNSQFLSTDDVVFIKHPVGDFIRKKFDKPSRFER